MARVKQDEEVAKIAPVMPHVCQMAEHVRQNWVITVPPHATDEQLTEPAYWAHVAGRMQPWAEIDIRAEDGTWLKKGIVWACDSTWARVNIIATYELDPGDVSMSTNLGYEVEYAGPSLKWRVIRTSDRKVLVDKLGTKSDVESWLKDHRQVIAA